MAPLIGAEPLAAVAHRIEAASLVGLAKRTSPLKHIVVACQENHSFDHYFGTYDKLPKGYGIPHNWQNSGYKPFHFANLEDDYNSPYHDWQSTHQAWDHGKMDGFVSNGNGRDAMGYYTAKDLPFYYSLASEYTLCAEYFCGMLTETLPNRMVLYAGTSGGITDDYAPVNGSLTWPCITTLLRKAGISYKNYNFHCWPDYSYLSLWRENNGQPHMNQTISQFMSDCKRGTLPRVSFITNAPPYDEHPTADIHTGEGMVESIYRALKASPQWESTALLITWDEGGGFFDHRPPKELDAWGSGIRVPMIVASPLAKKGHVDTTYCDHASVLKFIEHVFGLPTLASINHRFDHSTPFVGDGGGAPFPPRDGNSAIGNLTHCFRVAV